MNTEKQTIAIAEFCGWKEIGRSGIYQNVSKGVNGCMPNGEVHKKRIKMKLPGANSFLVPDYVNDLNAMHEAEKTIENNPSLVLKYYQTLTDMIDRNPDGTQKFGACLYWDSLHASAKMRAEAFLRTIGKWEE